MDPANFLLLATVCLLGMLSPGPDFILVTRNALCLPRAQALATAFGVVAGCLVHGTYCTLGLALLITQSVVLFGAVKYLGACYLVYLGIKGLFARPAPVTVSGSVAASAVTVSGAFVQGFLCNLLNPKLAVFLLSLFTQFIAVDAPLPRKATVAAVLVGEALVYWPALVLVLQRAWVQRVFTALRHLIDRTCGALLILAGLKVAIARNG